MGAAPALLSLQQNIALSYDQLRCQVQGLSAGLQDRGVELGDSVVTDIPNVAEGLLLDLACSRLGAAIATAKDASVLNTIPNVRCAVTASSDSWLSQHSLSAPPLIADGEEMDSMLRSVALDDPDDDDRLIDRHASLRPLGYFGSANPRAETTLNTLVSEQCTLLFADTHTLKAMCYESLSGALDAAELSSLRGGVCKTGSGTDILSEMTHLKGVKLSTLGKEQ